MHMKGNTKKIVMGVAIAFAAIYLYNRIPQVKKVLGGA
jgi:hypothetical protein